MTSVERVKAALNFEEPDKVPLANYAIDCDTVSRLLGRKTFIRDKAGTQIAYWEGRRDEIVESLIEDIPELYQKLDILDVMYVAKIAMVPPRGHQPEAPTKIGDGVWEDRSGRVFKRSEVTNEIVCVKDPHKWDRQFKLEDFDLDPEVGPEDESTYEVFDAVLPQVPKDKYVIGRFPMAQEQVLLGGYERGLVEVAMQPEVVERAVQAGIARARKQQQRWHNRGFHGVMNENDFGHTTSTFVSPEVFRRLFLPAVEFNVQSAHEAGLDFFQHSCGDNKPILDQLVGAGIDCYQSMHPEAGMDPWVIKEMAGNQMAVWGGVNVASLVAGTPDDVRADVRRAMERAKPGGGFLLGSSHSIAWGTKYDNFMAMLDEFEKLRDY